MEESGTTQYRSTGNDEDDDEDVEPKKVSSSFEIQRGRCDLSYHTISYYTISYHIIHTMSQHLKSCHNMSCHIRSRRFASSYVMTCHKMSNLVEIKKN